MSYNNLLIEIRSILYQSYWRVETEQKDDALNLINEARTKLDDYLAHNNINSGDWGEGREQTSSSKTKSERVGPKIVRHGKIDRQYNQQLDGVGNPNCPLYDKQIRITGTFEQIGMSRDEVAAACQSLGAKKVSEGIAKTMQVVIMGNNAGPSKMEKIKLWQSEGHDITVLSQFDIKKIFDEFLTKE